MTDKEIMDALMKEYPPTNTVVLERWRRETKNDNIKKCITQWIKVVEHEKVMIDQDVFQQLLKERKMYDDGLVKKVLVGNIGTVYEGTDTQEALDNFYEYREQSMSGVGRDWDESVYLFVGDEPEIEHIGKQDLEE